MAYAQIGSSGSFAIRRMPDEPRLAAPISKRMASNEKDLIAIGPGVVAVGEVLGSDGNLWTIEIEEFLLGDWRRLSQFVDGFGGIDTRNKYILVNAMNEGRTIADAPAWRRTKRGTISFSCNVAPPAERISAERLPG